MLNRQLQSYNMQLESSQKHSLMTSSLNMYRSIHNEIYGMNNKDNRNKCDKIIYQNK